MVPAIRISTLRVESAAKCSDRLCRCRVAGHLMVFVFSEPKDERRDAFLPLSFDIAANFESIDDVVAEHHSILVRIRLMIMPVQIKRDCTADDVRNLESLNISRVTIF